MSVEKMLEDLVVRNPELGASKKDISKAFELLKNSYGNIRKITNLWKRRKCS